MRTNNKSLHIISPSNDFEYTIVGRTHRLKLIESIIECQQDPPPRHKAQTYWQTAYNSYKASIKQCHLRTPYVIDLFLWHNRTTIKIKFRIVGITRINCSFDFSCHLVWAGKFFFFSKQREAVSWFPRGGLAFAFLSCKSIVDWWIYCCFALPYLIYLWVTFICNYFINVVPVSAFIIVWQGNGIWP